MREEWAGDGRIGREKEEALMRRAISLARMGDGRVSPNPLVGAVIARGGRILGEGYHRECGGLHAERNALAACGDDPAGATLYVTLEPCCHHGRTPPCTEAIIQAGISRVVIGSGDPNPLVDGGGAQALRKAGIRVTEQFLIEECDRLNPVFFHYITTGLPYVVMKYGMTADGKTAAATGASRWITGEEARGHVHALRNRYRGIMAGIGTVLADDPLLTCRAEGGKDPVRIICDSRLRIPLNSRLVRTAKETPLIVAGCRDEFGKRERLTELGATVLMLPELRGKVDLAALLTELGRREIDGILLEGGSCLNYAMLEAGLVNRVCAYIGAKLLGGERARTPVGGAGVETPDSGWRLSRPEVTAFGDDVLLEYEVVREAPDPAGRLQN